MKISSVWLSYRGVFGDRGIMDFADIFNRKYSKSEISPPLRKILAMNDQVWLWRTISILIVCLPTIIYIFNDSKIRAPSYSNIFIFMLGWLLAFVSLFCVLRITSILFRDQECKDCRKYVKEFETLGGEFAETFLENSPPGTGLKERCLVAIKRKAKDMIRVNRNPALSKKLRVEINRAFDLLVETGVLQESEVHDLYTKVFADAQTEIDQLRGV
jgi:hypothetical protein